MTRPQKHFAGPTRPLEELYDCEADPQNLTNLADSPDYRSTLERMQSQLEKRLRDSRDLGFIPEAQVNRVKVGAIAGARLAAGGGEVQGRVTFVSRSSDPTTRTFLTEIEVPNPHLAIRGDQIRR